MFATRTIDELEIDDEGSFAHVGLYAELKEVLRLAGYRFRVLPQPGTWSRALFLNLTFWSPEGGGDVLADEVLPADVVCHVAWHHLASKAVGGSASALFLGESIASAFDLYLVGRLLGRAPDSAFLETQVPALAEAAQAAGLADDAFEALLGSIAAEPERAFEDLRQLLFDAPTKLAACRDADEALEALVGFEKHRFGALLHHYEISNWVLYTRAYAPKDDDGRAVALDRELREAPVSLDVLEKRWLAGVDGASKARPRRMTRR